ncbi:MAG: hypothetical protein K2K88_00375 [Muribaculaceae bacterium]|nr:hypothetical protein [Muribaculaceae bacterium]
MNKTAIFVTIIATLMSGFTATAQRDSRHFEKGVVTIINNDTTDTSRIEKVLKQNSPQSPNDNGLPRFALVGKNDKFYVAFGGQFLGEAVVDFGDNMPSAISFTPAAMTPSTPGNRSNLGFGWQSSSIYMNIVTLPGTKDQVGLFFKANFTGNNNSFSVYHFYARYRGLQAGYTSGVFTDAAAEPMTIDFEGPNGYPYATLFNVSWTQKFNDHFSGAIGIDAPSVSMTSGTSSEVVNQRIPAIPVYVQYGYNDGNSHVRLSGLVRPMQYRNLRANHNETLTGLGIQLSGMTPVVGALTFNYNAVFGRGISNYIQDDNGLGLDAVSLKKNGKMGMVKSLGLTAGLNYAFNSKLSTNLTYSHLVNYLPENTVSKTGLYRSGDYVAANVIYNINNYLSAGIEYDYGHRKDFKSSPLHTNRLQLQLAVTF